MKTGQGLRRYLYEYTFFDAVGQAREKTGAVIPISQAKAIRRAMDEKLAVDGYSVAHPKLGVNALLTSLDASMAESVPNYEPLFGDHTMQNENYQRLQAQFMKTAGINENVASAAALPISPYDPDWSERGTVKAAGTSVLYIQDQTIEQSTGGSTEDLFKPEHGQMAMWTLDEDGRGVEMGPAMTDEDASGLTSLRDRMSVKDYSQVRQWVIDGGRDPRTGLIDRNRFMSNTALARSVAILDELQSQGIGYEIQRDQNPGQIKARVTGTTMDIRLTEPAEREDYAGARIYDNGTMVRYSTNHKVGDNRTAIFSPTPDDAVRLLRFAQGRALAREDKPELQVGAAGSTHEELVRRNGVMQSMDVEDSYHMGKTSMFAVKDFRVPGEQPRDGSKVFLRRESANKSLPAFYNDAESGLTAAQDYLRESVSTARANLAVSLDVEGLIDQHQAQLDQVGQDGELEAPVLASDPEIAAIQRSYWDVLTGKKETLLRPGATEQMYDDRLGAIGELAADDLESVLGNLAYEGSPNEKVREHAGDTLGELVGTFDAETHLVDDELVDQRFDPLRVAKYMTSSAGQFSNLDNLAAALRRAEIEPSEMMGTGFQANRFKDRLVRFDAATSVDMFDHDSEFIQRVGASVYRSLERNATEIESIQIDEQGVIRWEARKLDRTGASTEVSGEIGQVFDVGSYGEIVTGFAGDENALIVPGYEARIAAQVPGETKSVEERTLLRGYEQALTERIEHQIAGDLLSGRSHVGEGASINGVYSQLYGTKHPVDFIEQNLEHDGTGEAKLDEWTASILATEAKRVRYSNEIKAGSTVYAEHRSKNDKADPANDNHFDAWKLTGGRNMAVLTGEDQDKRRAPGGYFDPVMTGGATNQGIVRYLTTDARVSKEGQIVPGDPKTVSGSRAPLMARDELETLRFDPFDRQQMTASTLMQSSKVSEPTGTAMMTFGGWTADDPIVVSTEFAQKHRILGVGGKPRDLVVGDKLSDLHGNKGVVSLVVDRNMDLAEAKAMDLEQEVSWFKANENMDVVMSPFSMISRRNAGSARELMGSLTEDRKMVQEAVAARIEVLGDDPELRAAGERLMGADLTSPEGKTLNGGIGQMRFIVTHMAVDEKTKIYDDEAVLAGRGRKASSQLAWALGAQDCPAIMKEFYGGNSGAEANLREYMLSVGLDMEADGTLRVIGRDPGVDGLSHEGLDERPERRLFEMPELVMNTRGGLNTVAMRRQFGELIGDKGGDLEIPFPLRYATGEQTERVTSSNGESLGDSWKMPVLSSHLRSGQEFEDGSTVMHDYTNRYLDIYEQSCKYRSLQGKLDEPGTDQRKRAEMVDEMSKAASNAQRKFESITTDLENRVFSERKNVFKTGLMSSRLADSATAVWTSDPRLDIDQVALSPVMSEQLGLKEGDHALVWRDPVLRDAGLRYMRVAVDERLTGVAINPVMDACFDGDFDGDAVAVVKLHSKAAQAEALEKLSVPANLLDTGVVSKNGQHPLAMQVSLDTQVAVSKDVSLKDSLESLATEANSIGVEAKMAPLDPEIRTELRSREIDVAGQLSDTYREAQRGEFGAALTFSDLQAHLNSVNEVCVKTGAKGSASKLGDYARYLGGNNGYSGITQKDQEDSMFATAIKSHGTGLGGSYSQRAVRALRNTDLKAVLEVTYPVTQSILQAKHDATEARHKYEMLHGPGRELWRGRKLEHQGPGQWKAVYEDGDAVQATAKEWKDQFIDFYSAKDGFNVTVNPEYVERVATALTDAKTGRIRNLEEDVSLQGSLMDRMAYGGNLQDLIAAADNHENLYEGAKNAQFAPMPTRHALAANDVALEALTAGEELETSAIDNAVLKPDTIASVEEGAKSRGANRMSKHAVSVGARRSEYRPSIPIDEQAMNDNDGMGY